jgi:hypothetical protein
MSEKNKPEIQVPKYYKSLDTLPIYNFYKILKDVENNIGYLQIFDVNEEPPKLNLEQRVLLSNAWRQMLYELPQIDCTLYEAYLKWQSELLKIVQKINLRNIETLESHLRNRKEKKIKIDYTKVITKFQEYFNEFNLKYTKFETIQYYLDTEKLEKLKKEFPKMDFSKIEEFNSPFWIIEEFYFHVENDKQFANVQFFNQVFSKEKVKLKNLKELNEYLKDFFLNKIFDYEKYILIQGAIFDLNSMDKEPTAPEQDIHQDICNINFITKQNLNLKKSSVSELFALRSFAEKLIREQNKSNKKSSSNEILI